MIAANLPHKDKQTGALILLSLLLIISGLLLYLGIKVGSSGFDVQITAPQLWLHQPIIWDIRLPRSIGAWAAGALLGLAGAVAQGLFRNPLADPFLLGSASGASLGIAIQLSLAGSIATQSAILGALGANSFAFAGALLGVILTTVLAKGVQHPLRLLLSGVIVAYVLGAVKELFTTFSPHIQVAMQAFNNGSTGYIDWSGAAIMLGVWLASLLLALASIKVLDALRLGESTAISLGLPMRPLRIVLIVVIALTTGTAVAATGLIAFVGLAAPHLIRSMVHTHYRYLIVLSSLMGAVLLLGADIFARWLIAPAELPVGIVTALFGGIYLLVLLHRKTQHENLT